jgi:hypothetical protein
MEKTFEIKSGKVVLSDPCYDFGTWCQGVIDNVKNGNWYAEADTQSFGQMNRSSRGHRIAKITAYHENFPTSSENIQNEGELLDFDGGVDSGQFGYFDIESYRNDDSVQDLKYESDNSESIICEDEPFYSHCCNRTLGKEGWGVLPFGVVSSSGYGDGSYTTYGIKNDKGEYVGFTTIFIDFDDDEEEYDDDEEDDDDE